MAWCCQATSHYLSQCWPRSLTPFGVARPHRVNPCLVELFWQSIKILFAFPIISQNWDGLVNWNISSWETRTHLSCIVNAMAADVLAPYITRASAVMALNKFFPNIPTRALKELKGLDISHCPRLYTLSRFASYVMSFVSIRWKNGNIIKRLDSILEETDLVTKLLYFKPQGFSIL